MPNLHPPMALVIERPAGVIEQAVTEESLPRWLYTMAQVVPLDHSTTWYVRRR